ncbi:hypothetical protein MRB53_021704 [Persea americana]|uniref:Uncharacterized protein n=1 Tax=Persea americana TaxID=3435 RepID=A0ACC2L5N2_PERAE|nr:hypothetical protein MRB53_021704 [Persea americana]
MPLLKGHNLMGFIDGTNPCPPIFVTAAKDDGSKSKEDDSPSLNPDYVSWSRQYQLLLSWILSSLTEGDCAQVVGLSTSYEVWHHLATTYASTSKARIMQLRLQLHQLKKGADTMSEFLLKAKSIADQLAIALKPIDDDDLVLYILGGLGSESGPFVTSITTREAHIRLSDLHGLLLSEEIRVNGSQNDLQNITANVAAKRSSSSNCGKGSLEISEHVPPTTTIHIHPMVTRLRDGIRKPKMLLATEHPISVDVALVDPLHDEPTCVTEAAKHSHWRAAMNSEFNALIRSGMCQLGAQLVIYEAVVPGADKVFETINVHVLEFSFGKTIDHHRLI